MSRAIQQEESKLERMTVLVLVATLCLYRVIVGVGIFRAGVDFMPLLSLSFCSASYLTRRYHWILPAVTLLITDAIINRSLSYPIIAPWTVTAGVCYVLAARLGQGMALRKSWVGLLVGTLACVLGFYLISNTMAFLSLPAYPRSLAGWIQALSVGFPGYPPTWMFLRNSMVGNLGFTAAMILVMDCERSALGKSRVPIWRPKLAASFP